MKKLILGGTVLLAFGCVGLTVMMRFKSEGAPKVSLGTEVEQDAGAISTGEADTSLSQTYQNIRYYYSFRYPVGYQPVYAAVENPRNTPVEESAYVGIDNKERRSIPFMISVLPLSPESLAEYAAQMLSGEYGVDVESVRDGMVRTKVSGLDAYRVECLRNCIPVSSSRVFLELPSGVRFEVVVGNGDGLPERILETLSFEK